MMYNKLIEDCFFHPRHVGALDEKQPLTVHCRAGQEGGNLLIDWYWECSSEGCIKRACFKVVGNPYVIACLEWLCRQLEGVHVDSLPVIEYPFLISELGIPRMQYPVAVQMDALYKKMSLLMKNKCRRL
ncbi:MAG: iron-sulfur cluster assembly scaffold protein [Legionellales bacterium]